MGGDRQQPPIEATESAAGFLVSELAPKHLEKVACGGQGCAYAGQTSGGGGVGNGEHGHAMRLCGTAAGSVELAVQIVLRDLDVTQGHADIFVSE